MLMIILRTKIPSHSDCENYSYFPSATPSLCIVLGPFSIFLYEVDFINAIIQLRFLKISLVSDVRVHLRKCSKWCVLSWTSLWSVACWLRYNRLLALSHSQAAGSIPLSVKRGWLLNQTWATTTPGRTMSEAPPTDLRRPSPPSLRCLQTWSSSAGRLTAYEWDTEVAIPASTRPYFLTPARRAVTPACPWRASWCVTICADLCIIRWLNWWLKLMDMWAITICWRPASTRANLQKISKSAKSFCCIQLFFIHVKINFFINNKKRTSSVEFCWEIHSRILQRMWWSRVRRLPIAICHQNTFFLYGDDFH